MFVEECATSKAVGSVVMGLNCSIEQHDSDSFNSSRWWTNSTWYTSLQELKQSTQQSLISGHPYANTNNGWQQVHVQHALSLLCPCAAVGVSTSSPSWTGTPLPGLSSSLGSLKLLLLAGFMVCVKYGVTDVPTGQSDWTLRVDWMWC